MDILAAQEAARDADVRVHNKQATMIFIGFGALGLLAIIPSSPAA